MNRWVAEHISWPMTERLRRRDTMSRLDTLRATQHLTAAQLRELQQRKLRRLLIMARAHCPFYAERFADAGWDIERAQLADLARLPTLSRDDIRDNLDRMTWRGAPAGGPQPHNTGGSSGEPLQFYFDRSRQAADWAARWRAREWWHVPPGSPELLLWGAPIELRAHDRLRRWRDALLNQEILDAFDMTDEQMDAYLKRIRDRRPRCLYGYASSMALLARHALGNKAMSRTPGTERLTAVFVTGEVLLPEDRKVIESAFGAPVGIEYGCRDGGLIAFSCPSGLLHVTQENMIVELLAPNGGPVPHGEIGEVAVTHLEAFAMPIIRYRTGDLARAPEPGDNRLDDKGVCRCGLKLETLAEVRGRLTDQIVCRHEGRIRRMHALALMYVVRETPGIRRFRITQKSIDSLDVEIVTDEKFTPAAEKQLEAGLCARMGAGVRVRIKRRDRIPPSASGKHACVISQVTADGLTRNEPQAAQQVACGV